MRKLSQAFSFADPRTHWLSQAAWFGILSAKAVPTRKMHCCEYVEGFAEQSGGGRKVLLTMFARQLFPTSATIETFH
jgi:hypothetical protein